MIIKRLFAHSMLTLVRWLIQHGFTKGNQKGYLDFIIELREMAK